MRDKFYDSSVWQRKRKKILRRDGYLCAECRRYHRVDENGEPIRATTVHHIKPREFYPELSLDENNLISLCEGCHNKKHPERTRKTRPGRRSKSEIVP